MQNPLALEIQVWLVPSDEQKAAYKKVPLAAGYTLVQLVLVLVLVKCSRMERPLLAVSGAGGQRSHQGSLREVQAGHRGRALRVWFTDQSTLCAGLPGNRPLEAPLQPSASVAAAWFQPD